MSNTPILDLPEIAENQGDKYITHNSALNKLEAFTKIISMTISDEPVAPAEGDCYIIPAGGGTGTIWSTFNPNSIAHYYGNTWKEYVPKEGWNGFVVSESDYAFFTTSWLLLGTGNAPRAIGVLYGASGTTTIVHEGGGTTTSAIADYGSADSSGVTVDAVAGTITVVTTGIYRVTALVTIDGNTDGIPNDTVVRTFIDKNGTGTFVNSYFLAKAGEDIFAQGFSILAGLLAGDVLTVTMNTDTNGGLANLVIPACSFSISQEM